MQMKFDKTVYVETSVASYLTTGTFTNPAKIARQLATTDWSNFWGPGFELYTSDLTIEEAERGHHGDAAQALKALDGITNLPITNAVNTLADVLTLTRALPPDSRNDAVHVALAAVHDIDYILTWKSRLLEKEVTGPNIRQVCEQHRYRSPETCTPHALVGEVPIWYGEILEELWEIRYNMSLRKRKVTRPHRRSCATEGVQRGRTRVAGWRGYSAQPRWSGLVDRRIQVSPFPARRCLLGPTIQEKAMFVWNGSWGAISCLSRSTYLCTRVAGCGATASRVIPTTGIWIWIRFRAGSGWSPKSRISKHRAVNRE